MRQRLASHTHKSAPPPMAKKLVEKGSSKTLRLLHRLHPSVPVSMAPPLSHIERMQLVYARRLDAFQGALATMEDDLDQYRLAVTHKYGQEHEITQQISSVIDEYIVSLAEVQKTISSAQKTTTVSFSIISSVIDQEVILAQQNMVSFPIIESRMESLVSTYLTLEERVRTLLNRV